MKKELAEVIEGHPYPVAHGGWRCCIGGVWQDCDKNGKPRTREGGKRC